MATAPKSEKKIATAVAAKPLPKAPSGTATKAVAAKKVDLPKSPHSIRPTASVAKATVAKIIPAPARTAAVQKPIKTAFTKTTLATHLAQAASVDLKAVKAVLGALEATMIASLNKKGLGAFTLPGLMTITSKAIPAKKKRRGLDPFTKVEREFAAKPATTRVSARVKKKLKDAAK